MKKIKLRLPAVTLQQTAPPGSQSADEIKRNQRKTLIKLGVILLFLLIVLTFGVLHMTIK